MDETLTASLLNATLDLMAENGLPQLSGDAVAMRARAGKAAIYRRWASIPLLVSDAVLTCSLIPSPPDTGSLRSDLLTLLEPLTRALTRCERAVSALAGNTRPDNVYRHALDVTFTAPIDDCLRRLIEQQAGRSAAIPVLRVELIGLVVRSIWWQRYVDVNTPAHYSDIVDLVDLVLLPAIFGLGDPTSDPNRHLLLRSHHQLAPAVRHGDPSGGV